MYKFSLLFSSCRKFAKRWQTHHTQETHMMFSIVWYDSYCRMAADDPGYLGMQLSKLSTHTYMIVAADQL